MGNFWFWKNQIMVNFIIWGEWRWPFSGVMIFFSKKAIQVSKFRKNIKMDIWWWLFLFLLQKSQKMKQLYVAPWSTPHDFFHLFITKIFIILWFCNFFWHNAGYNICPKLDSHLSFLFWFPPPLTSNSFLPVNCVQCTVPLFGVCQTQSSGSQRHPGRSRCRAPRPPRWRGWRQTRSSCWVQGASGVYEAGGGVGRIGVLCRSRGGEALTTPTPGGCQIPALSPVGSFAIARG